MAWAAFPLKPAKIALKSPSCPSELIHLKRWVEMFEFDARVGGRELPVGFCVIFVSVCLPGGNFVGEELPVGNAPIEALG